MRKQQPAPVEGKVTLHLDYKAPDRRIRDLDNLLKPQRSGTRASKIIDLPKASSAMPTAGSGSDVTTGLMLR